MAEVVSCWPSTFEMLVLSQASPHEICGGQHGIGTAFSLSD